MIGDFYLGAASRGSLFMPRQDSVLLTAISWIEGTLLGTLATIIAILAVAGIGFLLLYGRLVLRDGMRVFVGCFILFGAGSIATGIRSLADGVSGNGNMPQLSVQQSVELQPLVIPENPNDYDPYAGASVPVRR